MKHRTRRWAAALIAVAWMFAATPALSGTGREALVGTTCAISNLLYGPTKLGFALVGGLVGGLAYLFSFGDQEASGPIIRCSLRGDYAISPEHFGPDRELEFCGRSDEQRAARSSAGERDPGTGPAPTNEDW